MFGTIVLAVPISVFSSNFNSENQITEAEQIVNFDRETKRVLVSESPQCCTKETAACAIDIGTIMC